jgi:hypothetical protein
MVAPLNPGNPSASKRGGIESINSTNRAIMLSGLDKRIPRRRQQ